MNRILSLLLAALLITQAHATDTTTTALMNMTLPLPGLRAGPTWASDINTAFGVIDSHDHTTGKGAKVPTAGLNINADLSFGGYNATTQRASRFSSQSAALSTGTDKDQVYVVNGDLYYNNDSGTAVRITSGSSLDASGFGSISGMGGTGAAVTYSNATKNFLFTQSSGVTGKISTGDISLYETVASSNPITLKSPTSLASSYTLTLPTALPAQTNVMTISAAGALSSLTYNNLAENRTRATGTSVAVGGVAISSSSGAFSTANGTLTDITNLSVTITTSGRPVMVMLIPDGAAATNSALSSTSTSGATTNATYALVRGTTILSITTLGVKATGSAGTIANSPPGSLSTIDAVAAGTYTYKAQARVDDGDFALATRVKLIAYEL